MSPKQLKVYNKLVVWLLHTENCGSKESTQAQSEPGKYNNPCCGGTVPEAMTPTAWTKHKSQLHRRYHLPSTFAPTILIYTSLLVRYKANPTSKTAYTTAVPSTWYCTKRTPQVQQLNSTVVPSTGTVRHAKTAAGTACIPVQDFNCTTVPSEPRR